jgi:hypothetical protein
MPDVDLAGLGERAAEAVHHAWLGVQAAAGIRSRLAAWGEELVAPWDALSERAKDLDRATVAATLEYVRPHIVALGLQEARTRLAAVDMGPTSPVLGPSYMRISLASIRDGESTRQIHASDTVIVDVAEDGRVLGVECLDGLVGMSAMLTAFQGIRVAEPPPTEHRYLSCACLHAQLLEDAGDEDQAKQMHKQCGKAQHDRGEDGHPHCKYCPSPCRCRCHVETGEAT